MGFLGFWLAKTAVPKVTAKQTAPKAQATRQPLFPDDPPPQARSATRETSDHTDQQAADSGALLGQRALIFKDQAALEAFLKKAGNQLQIMGRLDALNALRVGFLNAGILEGLLDGTEELSMIFPVNVPTNGEGIAQADAVPLGGNLLEWLGITGDNSRWGTGIKIAILDTGVLSHTGTSGKVSWINLLGDDAPPITNGHGTAVASMINGTDPTARGIAPGAPILSIRIADRNGESNSFLLASGIIAAADAGASLINVSMGSFGDSLLVRNAIDYARKAGSVIIAAAGNNGQTSVTQPAANKGVTAIGAVDARGVHMKFSNTGAQIAFSAPGYGLNAAYTNNQYVSVTGTSFSAPIFTGMVAAVMTAAAVNSEQALALIYKYSNDINEPGYDQATGWGVPDMERILNRNTRGIYDAALASQRILPPSAGFPYGQIEVLIQNRGTENLINTKVSIHTPVGVVNNNITTLPPQAVQVLRVPITVAPRQDGSVITYRSQVFLSQGHTDRKPSNDTISYTYAPTIK